MYTASHWILEQNGDAMIRQEGQLITRIELYEQIWDTPISLLAKKYGISDVGLAKICRRMDIPRPPRGYWSKLKIGKAPPKSQLRPISDSGLDRILITPTPKNLWAEMVAKPLEFIPVIDILVDPHMLTKKTHAALTRGKCVFHVMLAGDFTLWWPPISRDGSHRFHGMVAAPVRG